METVRAEDASIAFFRYGETNLRFIVGEYANEAGYPVMAFLRLHEINVYEVINVPEPFRLSGELVKFLWSQLKTNNEPTLRIPGGYYMADCQAPVADTVDEDSTVDIEIIGESIIDGHCYGLLAYEDNHGPCFVIGILPKGGTWEPIPTPNFIRENPVIMDIINDHMLQHGVDRMKDFPVH